MINIPNTSLSVYIFPEDRVVGKQAFLDLLHNPHETYIFAYNFSLPELMEEIKLADSKGIKVHCLIDRTQSAGPSEKEMLKTLHKTLKNSEIIVTTAGEGSDHKGQIWHFKTLVTLSPDGADCWEGSVNFSSSGFSQGNTAIIFKSDLYAQTIIKEFEKHKEWALKNHPEYQL